MLYLITQQGMFQELTIDVKKACNFIEISRKFPWATFSSESLGYELIWAVWAAGHNSVALL